MSADVRYLIYMAGFVVACLLFFCGGIAAVQHMQERTCEKVNAERISTHDTRGMGYVCVSPDGRVVKP